MKQMAMLNLQLQERQLNMEKNFSFFAKESRSQNLILECPLHYPLFYFVILAATSYLFMFVNLYVL